jgi:hypothetical protein
MGKIILNNEIKQGSKEYTIDLSKLKKGVYFYRINSCGYLDLSGFGKIILK